MAAFTSDDITKIYSFGGTFDPVSGKGFYKDGSAIQTPTELTSVAFGNGTAAPTSLSSEQLMANYTPEQIGGMNFDNVAAGQYGESSTNGLGSFTSKDFGNYASGIGAIGQLGLGALSYLENKETANKQRALLGQQYETNKELMANSRADRQHAINAFRVK